MALRLPGIIVRIINDAGIIAPPVYERYPVYIGEGDPYKLVSNTKLTRTADPDDTIPTMTTTHDIITVGDLPDIAKYIDGVDFTLVGNVIHWAGGAAPTAGDNYYITYTETRPASAYTPMLYFDENLIYADHGNKTRTNGAINDISTAGYLGLNAGAKGVIIAQLNLSAAVDPDAPTVTELENAFVAMEEELRKIEDYKLFLVPLSSGTLLTLSANTIFFNEAVVLSMPERKQERTVIGCIEQNATYLDACTTALSYAHERMVIPYAYDGKSKVSGDATEYDMRFYNASLAGLLCSGPIGEEFCDIPVPNVLINDNFEPDIYEYMLARGVSPCKVKGDVVRNIMSITTDTTSALTEALGIQDIKDYVKKYWREGLWAVYKNARITTGLIKSVNGSSKSILDYLLGQSIISEWRNVSVAQDPVEPRKLNVTAQIQPAYSLTWMDVTFTFVLSF